MCPEEKQFWVCTFSFKRLYELRTATCHWLLWYLFIKGSCVWGQLCEYVHLYYGDSAKEA